MNRRRLILFAALALAPLAPARSGAQPSPSEPRAIAPDVIAKLLKLIAAMGADTDLPAPIAVALGLAGSAQPWPDRQFGVQSDQDGAHHTVAIHRGGDQDMVYSVSGPAAVSVFRVSRDGALIKATAFFPDTGLTADLLRGQSLTDMAAEGRFWAAHVDALVGQL
jgi:hypothetical protein